MGACLDGHRQIGDLLELMAAQKPSVFPLIQGMFPCLVRRPLVTSLPVDILLILKSAGEETQEFVPCCTG